MRDPRKIAPQSEEVILSIGHLPARKINEHLASLGLSPLSRATIRRYRRRAGITVDMKEICRGEENAGWKAIPYKIAADGYVMTRVIENGKAVWRLAHRVEWEMAHGPIPKGMRLACLGERTDIRPDNWRLITHSAATLAAIHSPVKLAEAPAELKPAIIAIAEIKAKLLCDT